MAEAKTIPAPSINLVDESFDIKKSNQYHLSILANENGFAFAVLDTKTNKYLVLKETKSVSIFSHLGEGGNWASVSCAIAHNKFTLIPNPLFDEENKKSLLEFNHPVSTDEKIHSDILRNLKARNLFSVSGKFESEIKSQFTNARIHHGFTAFVEGLLVHNKNNTGKKVFANFYSSYFEIAILDGRNLLFSNSFQYKTSEDIAYYILFVYEQLHLNPETIELVLSGEIEKTDKEHSLLYTYIRTIKFASLPEGFSYSYKFEEIPSHKFFTLFSQYLVTN
ncbi:MAG: DUF3822 family protein [Bacteroidetes bacterium]|nr:DUF3822 family protein [Bacteroidota bacterium]